MRSSLLAVLALTFASSAFSVELLRCNTQTWNPSFDFQITKDNKQVITGTLTRVINGYAGTSRTRVAHGPIVLKLNPSTCDLRIDSRTNPQQPYGIALPLGSVDPTSRSSSGNLAFGGRIDIRSQDFGGSSALVCSPKNSDLVRSLIAVCDRFSSMDREIEFRKTTDVIRFLASTSPEVSDRSEIDESDSSYTQFDPFSRKAIPK